MFEEPQMLKKDGVLTPSGTHCFLGIVKHEEGQAPEIKNVKGQFRTDGEIASLSYQVDHGNFEEHKGLNCHKEQVVLVNNPNDHTEKRCKDGKDTCLLKNGVYYSVVNASKVEKSDEKLSENGCSAEGITCVVHEGQYYGVVIGTTKILIWE